MYEYCKVAASQINELNKLAKQGWEVVPGIVFEVNAVHYILMERVVETEPENGSLLI